MANPLTKANMDPSTLAGDPERELPPADLNPTRQTIVTEMPTVESSRANPRLNETAEAIGTAVGSAVRRIEEAKDRFTVIRGRAGESATSTAADLKESAQQKAQQIKVRAAQAVENVRTEATARLEDVRVRTSRALGEARDAAREKLEFARHRASRFANERPLHVIAGAAAIGFAIGILLRVWRSERD